MKIEAGLRHIGHLDELSRLDTPVHRLDARAKLLTTLFFVGVVASFPRYTVLSMIPLLLYPVALAALGRLPARTILGRMLWAAPFILFVGVFNPVIDREQAIRIGSLVLSRGWISFASILLRAALTVGAALILIAATGMVPLCRAMARLRVPHLLVAQILIMHRFLFLTAEEASRLARAHALRSGGKGVSTKVFGSLAGLWLLRTLDRAQRVHLAMACRGFDGRFETSAGPAPGRFVDWTFALGWSAFFLAARLYPIPAMLGGFLVGLS